MRTAVLIFSCDAFSDCWEPVAYSFKKYWNDCPFPVYIMSEFEEKPIEGINFIKVGFKTKEWSSRIKKALSLIDCEYILFIQDDCFLSHKVDTKSMLEHVSHCDKNGVDFLKIGKDLLSRKEYRIGSSIYCKNAVDVKYSINCAISIWRKGALEEVWVDGYTGWDFERKIVKYVKEHGLNIYSEIIHPDYILEKGITTEHGIRRGRWLRSGAKYLKDNGFERILARRDVEGRFLTFLVSLYGNKFLRIPVAVTIKIMQKCNLNF